MHIPVTHINMHMRVHVNVHVHNPETHKFAYAMHVHVHNPETHENTHTRPCTYTEPSTCIYT